MRHHGENTRKAGQEHRGISGKWQVGNKTGCDPLGQGNEKGSVKTQYGTWRQRPHQEMQVSSLKEGQEEAISLKSFPECFLLVLDRSGKKISPASSSLPYSDPGHHNGTCSHF